MKIQLIFTDANSGKEFEQTVELENNCLMDLLTDEAVKKIFTTETIIQRITKSVIFLREIKDVDQLNLKNNNYVE